jgi:membrane dipeptidase
MPLADAHSDLLMELVHARAEERPFAARWLGPLTAGGVQLQVCALFTDEPDLPERALRTALLGVRELDRAVAETDGVVAVRSAGDLDAALEPGRLGLVLALEGAEPLGYDPGLIDVFCTLGVRMASLTWNRRNAFADGCGEPPAGGLSALGRALVDRMASLPIAFDLAHASRGTFREVLDRIGDRPVLVSHALCRTLCDTPRNVDDDQLRALAERDGVLGVMALPFVLGGDEVSVDRLVDHVDHAVATVGVRHVALGGDFARQLERSGAFGAGALALATEIPGLAGPEDYPRLLDALAARGYSDDDLRALTCDNLVRVLRRALPD